MSGGLFCTDGGAMAGSSSGLDVSDVAEAWQRIRSGSEAWVLLETWAMVAMLGNGQRLTVSSQKFQGENPETQKRDEITGNQT